jgi:FMN phosphatase YigB (HAD superfamily)
LLPVFNHYYSNEYKELKAYARPNPAAKEVVDKLAGRGYRLVLATNPIFPREAILERMRWAGVDSAPWELITSYEEYHFCKPNPLYFDEILSKMRLSGKQALMVGNDTDADLIASTLGIKTYLATDNIVDRGNSPWKPDFRGKLAELPDCLENI